jgi:hypothetical protein
MSPRNTTQTLRRIHADQTLVVNEPVAADWIK